MAVPATKLDEKPSKPNGQPPAVVVQLPTQRSEPKTRMEDYIWLLYGMPKIGKTTLANEFGKTLFLGTEEGHNALKVFRQPIPDWPTFLATCAVIAKGGHDFTTICIDTVDNLHQACSEYVLQKAGVSHESDLEWGKGWQMVSQEFSRALTKLSLLPTGLVLISHCDLIEIKRKNGTTSSRWKPTMKKSAWEIVQGMSDVIGFYTTDTRADGTEYRTIKFRQGEGYEAGCRFHAFPAEIPIEDAKSGYQAIKAAFEAAIEAEVVSNG